MRLALTIAFALLPFATAAAPSPEQAWKADLVQTNKDYASVPHAILKIQDAAYLREGDTATLIGTTGKPETYHWVHGGSAKGVLTATVHGGHPTVAKAGKIFSESEIAKGIVVDKDVDIAGTPTQVSAGVIGARIFVFNQKSAAAKAFTGVDYFPYDPAYRVLATFVPDPKLAPRAFRTSRGTDKQFFHVGEASFTLKGRKFTLPFYADGRDPKKIATISAFFTDDLTGKGTYGAGRYVEADGFGAFPPKTITIDFNSAYNPNCARSAFFTCPVALDDIAIAVKAGERDPHFAH
jgi:uncharacterized protein (DUF1684 family)